MNEILTALLARKSIRAYTKEPISPEKKELLLRAACAAPTAGNQQLYTILDITDQRIKDKLAVSCDDQPFIAETVSIFGHDGKSIRAYWSRPVGKNPHPSLVLILHMPGWDEWCRETAHGYSVLCPNIYEDFGHGTPSEVAHKAREAGGVPDDKVMADTAGALSFLKNQPASNGKAGVIGMCSGGRHTFLAACTVEGIDAAVDYWGGGVVCPPEQLSPARPVAPIDYAEKLDCPLLGIFGNEDLSPTPADVDKLEAVLKELGKDYELHRYDGAGHGMWYYDKPMYRQEQAMDSWNKCIAFLDKHLKQPGGRICKTVENPLS